MSAGFVESDERFAGLRRFTVAVSDGRLAGLRFGTPGAPPLLFCHATGLCAAAYTPMFKALGDAVDGFALDMRGHGRSAGPGGPACGAEERRMVDWTRYAADIGAALDALTAAVTPQGPWTLAGHSMGGVSCLLASGGRSDVRAVRLFDPPLMPGPIWMRRGPIWNFLGRRLPIVQGAMRRRPGFESRDAARENYEGKRFFRDWAPEGFDGYMADGFLDEADGSARLACTPEWEAATFLAQGHTIWSAVSQLTTRAKGLRVWGGTGPDSPFRDVSRQRMRRAGAEVIDTPVYGHLWPLVDPGGAAAFIQDAARDGVAAGEAAAA
ncbi:MAG: alpha/beta fold hydrolase [Pseudomonadota bacterium]